MAPVDLPTYTDLATSTVTQRQSVPYLGSAASLQYHLNQLSGDVDRSTAASGVQFRVFSGAITLTLEQRLVIIEWTANPINDMYADAVLTVVLKADSESPRSISAPLKVDRSHFRECLIELLSEMFGQPCIDPLIRGDRLKTDHWWETGLGRSQFPGSALRWWRDAAADGHHCRYETAPSNYAH